MDWQGAIGLRRANSQGKNGVLAMEGDHLVFTQDYVFGSPSTAAAVCMARNANGRVEWKDAQGRSLREMQEQVPVENDA